MIPYKPLYLTQDEARVLRIGSKGHSAGDIKKMYMLSKQDKQRVNYFYSLKGGKL